VRETVTELTGSLLDRVLDDLARIIDAILALLDNAT
jgi:hypothetical protein